MNMAAKMLMLADITLNVSFRVVHRGKAEKKNT
jgi:hypothetical protein